MDIFQFSTINGAKRYMKLYWFFQKICDRRKWVVLDPKLMCVLIMLMIFLGKVLFGANDPICVEIGTSS